MDFLRQKTVTYSVVILFKSTHKQKLKKSKLKISKTEKFEKSCRTKRSSQVFFSGYKKIDIIKIGLELKKFERTSLDIFRHFSTNCRV